MTKKLKVSRANSLLIVTVAYVAALFIAYLYVEFFPSQSFLWTLFWADVAATAVIFAFSFLFSNSSVYDPFWSVIPPFIAWVFISQAPEDANLLRQLIVMALIILWSVRLTLNWARGWAGLHHEDWRYVHLAEKTGKLYWLVSFLGIHLFPTILVFLGCLPMYLSFTSTEPLGILDVLASVVTVLAIGIESLADEQLKRFKKNEEKGLMNTGIWAYSRHPNYFGEILFWSGMFLFCVHLHYTYYWWASVGFIAMILLFYFISIPMMERRMESKRKEYKTYREEVSVLVPWPRKKGSKSS